jgi:hypothetical protein
MEDISTRVHVMHEQGKAGYRVEFYENNVLIWHGQSQIALLLDSPDINIRVSDLIEAHRKELQAIEG